MKPIEGYDLVNEAGEVKRLPAGIYGVKITNVIDVPEKEYLEVYCDITKGEFANYFKLLTESGFKDSSKCIRSYTKNALAFFKGFITAVEKTNPGYHWDWDEKKLIGKNVMAVFGEEEYLDKDGNVKTSVKVVEFRSLEAFQKGLIKVPELKKLPTIESMMSETKEEPQLNPGSMQVISDDELPF